MTALPERRRADRWADWAVILTLAVALVLGATVMTLAQGQRATYSNTEVGLTLQYPQDWLLKPAEGLAFQAIAPESGTFKTTYQVRTLPITATDAMTSTLALALNNLALTRGQRETAFRLFEVSEAAPVHGAPTAEASYVYVAKPADLFVERMPAVARGLDVAVARGNRAYVFTLLAEDDAFDAAEHDFRRFVDSAAIQ
jgi:hypothetical protein